MFEYSKVSMNLNDWILLIIFKGNRKVSKDSTLLRFRGFSPKFIKLKVLNGLWNAIRKLQKFKYFYDSLNSFSSNV